MKRRKTLMWVVAGAVFVLAVIAFVVRAVRRDGAMHGALRELQEWNLADTVFRSDSAAQVLVNYFDYPWHNANDTSHFVVFGMFFNIYERICVSVWHGEKRNSYTFVEVLKI